MAKKDPLVTLTFSAIAGNKRRRQKFRISHSVATAVVVRLMRHAAELTQSELARRLKVSQPRVSRMERGIYRTQPATLERVARVCGWNFTFEE